MYQERCAIIKNLLNNKIPNTMLKKIINFFDKTEDETRSKLSHHPIVYAFIGGLAVVMFWRAVWETIDILWRMDNIFLNWFFYPPLQIIVSMIILLITGLMVSNFIGDRILLSGLKKEKKIEEKTEEIVKEEEITLKHIKEEIYILRREIKNIADKK